MKRICLFASIFLMLCQAGRAQNITVQADANEGRISVTPYIYGRDNNLSDNPATPVSADNNSLSKEAGLWFARERFSAPVSG